MEGRPGPSLRRPGGGAAGSRACQCAFRRARPSDARSNRIASAEGRPGHVHAALPFAGPDRRTSAGPGHAVPGFGSRAGSGWHVRARSRRSRGVRACQPEGADVTSGCRCRARHGLSASSESWVLVPASTRDSERLEPRTVTLTAGGRADAAGGRPGEAYKAPQIRIGSNLQPEEAKPRFRGRGREESPPAARTARRRVSPIRVGGHGRVPWAWARQQVRVKEAKALGTRLQRNKVAVRNMNPRPPPCKALGAAAWAQLLSRPQPRLSVVLTGRSSLHRPQGPGRALLSPAWGRTQEPGAKMRRVSLAEAGQAGGMQKAKLGRNSSFVGDRDDSQP